MTITNKRKKSGYSCRVFHRLIIITCNIIYYGPRTRTPHTLIIIIIIIIGFGSIDRWPLYFPTPFRLFEWFLKWNISCCCCCFHSTCVCVPLLMMIMLWIECELHVSDTCYNFRNSFQMMMTGFFAYRMNVFGCRFWYQNKIEVLFNFPSFRFIECFGKKCNDWIFTEDENFHVHSIGIFFVRIPIITTRNDNLSYSFSRRIEPEFLGQKKIEKIIFDQILFSHYYWVSLFYHLCVFVHVCVSSKLSCCCGNDKLSFSQLKQIEQKNFFFSKWNKRNIVGQLYVWVYPIIIIIIIHCIINLFSYRLNNWWIHSPELK
mgnify:CR=1 FL=1